MAFSANRMILSPRVEKNGPGDLFDASRYLSTGATPGMPSSKKLLARANRDQLLQIHKREVLKGLLINKFRNKYSKGQTNLASYIDNEVQRFLTNDRLTEDNLKKLDEKICKEAFVREKKEFILDDSKSTVSSHRNSLIDVAPPRSAGGHQIRGSDRMSQTIEMPQIKKDGGMSER